MSSFMKTFGPIVPRSLRSSAVRILGTLCMGTVALQAQDSLSVEQAVRSVLSNHPAIVQATAQMHAQEARMYEHGAVRYPTFEGEASYARIGPVPGLDFGGMGFFQLAPASNVDAHLGGSYLLYDFGKSRASMQADAARVKTSSDAIALVRTTLAAQTIRTFYSIALLQKSLQIERDQLTVLNEHLDVTRKRVAAGTATEFDVLTTQARIAAAENQTADVENALSRQYAALRQLLGQSPGQVTAIQGDIPSITVSLDADSLLTAALRTRPEVQVARDAEQAAKDQRTAVGRDVYPSIHIGANAGVKNGYFPDLTELKANWVAGIRAEIPAFNPRQAPQEEEADATVAAEEAHRADVERQVRADVEQAIAEVRSAQKKMEISRVQLQQAHDAAAIARTRYETGSVTNLDLLDAETSESAARLALNQAQYRYVLSTFELSRATGSLLTALGQ